MKNAPIKPIVSYENFEKIDIRVGTIERVEDIRGAEKLVRLIVDHGDSQRTIIAGIKQEREDRGYTGTPWKAEIHSGRCSRSLCDFYQ